MNRAESRSWRIAVTAAVVLSEYFSLPYSRNAVNYLQSRHWLLSAVLLTDLIVAAGLAWLTVFYLKIRSGAAYAMLGAVALVFGLLARGLKAPEEVTHFIQWGVIAMLVSFSVEPFMNALRPLVAWATVASFALSALDEIIQLFLPNRYFQWRDMGMNVIGAALGLVVYFILRAYRNRAN
nr:VanZ family protein [Chloroflexota bacterium]